MTALAPGTTSGAPDAPSIASQPRLNGHTPADPRPGSGARPRAAGKFLAVGDTKLYVRGATYGTFAPDAAGVDYPAPAVVAADFAAMAAAGINALRTYTPPPR